MGKFDRYMLSQLMMFFGFAAVVLVLIYWVNRAVRLFDWLIASGQSAAVFLEFTALSLPNVIRLVLPVAAFVATLYTTNRLTAESEMVVVQANGFSPYRLARPVLAFGLIVATFMALLVHFAVPASHARLAERQVEVAENVTAQLLVEGRFVHPGDGMTLYIRKITGSGRLQDVYLRDSRNPERHITYTATEALLVRTEEGPRLIMYDGMAQGYETTSRELSLTRFDDFALDVSSLIAGGDQGRDGRTYREASTGELLAARPETAKELNMGRKRLHLEGHERIAQPLLAITAPLLGFATLLLGSFSRFGIRNQIFAAVGLVVLIYIIDSALEDFATTQPTSWPLVYVGPAFGVLLAFFILWLAANPQFWKRRPRPEAAP